MTNEMMATLHARGLIKENREEVSTEVTENNNNGTEVESNINSSINANQPYEYPTYKSWVPVLYWCMRKWGCLRFIIEQLALFLFFFFSFFF